MRVLWFAITPPPKYKLMSLGGGWIGSLEEIIRTNCPDIELGVAFECQDNCFKVEREGVVYYPLNTKISSLNKFMLKYSPSLDWKLLKPLCLKAIEDFKPDIIHVFGSEWPYGLLAKDIDIPIVIHMQGFWNIYAPMSDMVHSTFDVIRNFRNPLRIIQMIHNNKKSNLRMTREKSIMDCNKYFMGRTEWDKNIVKYYSPNSLYYRCEEAIRDEIKESRIRWKYNKSKTMKIVSISSGGSLKGSEIILKTAKLLKEFGFDFEWRVAGNMGVIQLFERKSDINPEAVNVTKIGLINAGDVVKELSEAHVYVHAAIIDNSPNSLCEAQLIGCPVVSTNVGGIPQLVEDGASGELYPYNEFHTLAFKLMNLHNDRDKLETLSKAGLAVSHARHDKKKLANRIESIYTQIISEYQLS